MAEESPPRKLLVTIARQRIKNRVDVDKICGARLMRTASLPFDHDLVVYVVGQ
jgi:hypothetical protein